MTRSHTDQKGRSREIVCHDDVQIEVIAEGGGPLIVLLPSGGRDSEDFDAIAAGIAAVGFRVLRPQPRGMGLSVGPMQDMTLHDFATDMAAVIENETGGPAIMIGHAFGNQVARITAVDYPDHVRGVVLAAAAAKNGITKELAAALGRCADLSVPVSERLKALQFAFFAPGHDASVWLNGWSKQTLLSQQAAIKRTPRDDWWSAGVAPILDLAANSDPWRPQITQDELQREFPERVTVAIIDDASHALIPEQPAAVIEEIVGWVHRLKSAA